MEPEEIFREEQVEWISKWFKAVLESYPAESAQFFRKTKDPFSNPVGATIRKGLNDLYPILLQEKPDRGRIVEVLEPIVRLRAVQEFTPSAALSFLFDIGRIIEAGVEKVRQTDSAVEDRLKIISDNIEAMVLIAFDLYMDCKKKIYTLRANQARDGVRQLLIKKGLISEIPDIDPDR